MSEPVSPRSRVPLPTPTPVPVPVYVKAFCTDKGNHRRFNINVYQQNSVTGEWHIRRPGGDRGYFHHDPITGPDGKCLLECRRCGRKPKVNASTLVKVLDALAVSDTESLDISHLPF